METKRRSQNFTFRGYSNHQSIAITGIFLDLSVTLPSRNIPPSVGREEGQTSPSWRRQGKCLKRTHAPGSQGLSSFLVLLVSWGLTQTLQISLDVNPSSEGNDSWTLGVGHLEGMLKM